MNYLTFQYKLYHNLNNYDLYFILLIDYTFLLNLNKFKYFKQV